MDVSTNTELMKTDGSGQTMARERTQTGAAIWTREDIPMIVQEVTKQLRLERDTMLVPSKFPLCACMNFL